MLCSRALQHLAVALFVPDVVAASQTVIGKGLFPLNGVTLVEG